MSRSKRNPALRLPSPTRRRLLQWAAGTGLLAALDRQHALAQQASDYRALVCIFLIGGNDGENTLVRLDTAGYQAYAAIRTPDSGINIPQAQLLPVQPARSSPPFGFHPSCRAFKSLFDQKRLAVVANMGMLSQPSTKAALETQGAARPANLFSHPDQQRALATGDPAGAIRIGWGGRMADRLDGVNGGALFPSMAAMNQQGLFINGNDSIPLFIPPGATLQTVQNPNPSIEALADAASRQILGLSTDNVYETVARIYAEESFASASVATPIITNASSVVRPLFANATSSIAGQLLNVALMLEGRAGIGLKRQVFYCSQGNYDTHGNQASVQRHLLDDLSQAVDAFQRAVDLLGIADGVTTFTLSDFGRTFKPAAGAGTDHGWGNYAFVLGGAVKGGDFYGKVPTMALDGPDDLGKEGRWIPTTSVEQYGATLCRWFGMPETDLPYIFPNIAAFGDTSMGFMA